MRKRRIREMLGMKVIGKCPFCNHNLFMWQHKGKKIIECSNCGFRLIKLKNNR